MNINKWIIMFIGLTFMFILLMIFGFVINNENPLDNPIINYESITSTIETFFSSVIFAPILETIIFQMFIYWGVGKLISQKRYFLGFYLISSSLLFGISHYYTILYFLYSTCGGLIFAYCYYIIKKQGGNAFVMTSLMHATFNFIIFCIGVILTS